MYVWVYVIAQVIGRCELEWGRSKGRGEYNLWYVDADLVQEGVGEVDLKL